MISRVADSCFWLSRYMERAESAARLLGVNRTFLLDIELPELERWRPVIVVSGEEGRFDEFHGEGAAKEGERVEAYLSWDRRCPVSIASSCYWARENARTIRETISHDMWESVNALWLWLTGGPGKRLYRSDRDAFYRYIKDSVTHFEGTTQHTMMRDEPFDFLHLGLLLERAAQTARMIDVKYHLLGPTGGQEEGPVEIAQWVALLRSCSAEESFLKHQPMGLSGPAIAEFLLLHDSFPRSVYYSIDRGLGFLQRIQAETAEQGGAQAESGERSAALLRALRESLRGRRIARILKRGLHEELTRIIDTLTQICDQLRVEYLDPTFHEAEIATVA